MNDHNSTSHDVIKSGVLFPAYAEAKAFKRANQPNDLGALNRGNGVDGAAGVSNADAAQGTAPAAPGVCAIFTSDGNGLEINGQTYTVDWLKDRGYFAAGDLVFMHYLGLFLRKVAASVEVDRAGNAGEGAQGGHPQRLPVPVGHPERMLGAQERQMLDAMAVMRATQAGRMNWLALVALGALAGFWGAVGMAIMTAIDAGAVVL